MGSRILWAIVLGFLGGVFVRSFFPIGPIYVIGAALCAATALLVSLVYRHHSRYALLAAIALIASGVGIMRMEMGALSGDPVLAYYVDKNVTLEGIVTDEPDVREKNVLVAIETRALVAGSSSIPVHAGILAHAPLYGDVSYGDHVRVRGTLRLPQLFDSGLGRQFNYPAYLAKDGISYELSYADIVIESNGGNPIKKAALYTKHLYLAGLRAAIAEPEAGLAGGITVGDKRSIGPELSDAFRRVSLVHVVVLSGYNITIVINAIAHLVSWSTRYVQFGISGCAVLFFILMSGGGASASRAGAMAMVAMFARVSGRRYVASRALAIVALVMVLWNPYILGFDPGFQLSALATLGLILFTPVFSARLHWLTEKYALREIAASTLATQLAVLPLLLYQNGQLSLVGFPANVLALAPIPLAMLFSFIAAIAGTILGPFAVIVGFPAYVVLSYIIKVAEVFAALPFAAVSLPAFSAWVLIPIYAALYATAVVTLKQLKMENPAEAGFSGSFLRLKNRLRCIAHSIASYPPSNHDSR